MPKEWDTEEVLAFVYDVRPWRDMDDAERAEWCRRVRFVRENITTDGKAWTNERLAWLFGLTLKGLKTRFTRSRPDVGSSSPGYNTSRGKYLSAARSALRHLPPADRASIIAATIEEDPTILADVLGGRPLEAARELSTKPPLSLSERWEQWVVRLNGVLMDGHRLAEEVTEAPLDSASAGVGYLLYQRITERQLDAELRDLIESAS